jgi:tRNA pseudouridine38-40 synthase
MKEANPEQNIIQNAKIKEYGYIFSFGTKNHPFCAPFMANFLNELDLPLMMSAAKMFEGIHNFQNFTARIQPNTKVIRTIDHCEIIENKELTANFFPKESYLLSVKGAGFMRYQIRMMMGALVLLGKGELEWDQLEKALNSNEKILIPYVAPGSGLFLKSMEFK